MNTKKFKGMSNFFAWLFRMAVIFCIVGIVLALSIFFFNIPDASSFEWHVGFNHLMEISLNTANLSTQEFMRPSLLTAALFLGMMSFIFTVASSLFTDLSAGKTPFTEQFAHQLNKIGKLLIITDVATPLVQSVFVNFLTPATRYLYVGISSLTLIGLLLYVVSEIFRYGITLQELSDETV